MMYKLIIGPDAEIDIEETCDWYNLNATSAGIETRFLESLDDALMRIASAPVQFPVLQKEVQRAVLTDFPYSVFFLTDKVERVVFVLAVLHHSRNPSEWGNRDLERV